MTTPNRYADWKAPDEDGQILIWPDPDALLRQTAENLRGLNSSPAILQGVGLPELRAAARTWIGHSDSNQPLIATGHQTELYHPGVWVKHAMINSVARKVGGQAYQLAVDTDAPKHLHLRWPGGSQPITEDDRLARAAWTGLLAGPMAGHINEVEKAFRAAEAVWEFKPMVDPFLEALRRFSIEQPTLPAALVNATHAVDWSLGLRHHALLLAPVWTSPAYLVFAHHLMARAEELAHQYNAALRDYRTEKGISSPGRPMPDLQVDADEIEAPFWVDDLAADSRKRLFLKRTAGGWALDDFVFDPAAPGYAAADKLLAYLRYRNLRIAPRALTLTMFMRLFLADQFVHGIGGGRYDQVTDRLINAHLGTAPPHFSVTTATLYFPAAAGQKRVSLRPLLQEGRRLRHGSFSREKREMAARIVTLPRNGAERRTHFGDMHRWLARQADSPTMHAWQQQLDHALEEQLKQKAIFDRELFFAIQPEERLRGIISRYDAQFAAV